jgi:hypothetical protein
MKNLKPRLINDVESDRRAVKNGWYATNETASFAVARSQIVLHAWSTSVSRMRKSQAYKTRCAPAGQSLTRRSNFQI